jgi:hypothetical protein
MVITPWNQVPCLPSANAVGCHVDLLPPLPANAAWTSDECNVTGTGISSGSACSATCLPGFVMTGEYWILCKTDQHSEVWEGLRLDMTCKGAAVVGTEHPVAGCMCMTTK